ncbi:WAT1-related protein [Vitis vinifera]|uniref:WAT1-related protein n=1 Tax=Vitis vinifera TaxID=29760 RepID=A0A438EYE4_VITVI|nr:WAT1-related protein [Vitis vinifera]
MGVKAWLSGMVPIAAMVMVECLDVGLTTLSKAAMSRGMDHFVFVVYSNAFASLILFSISFIFLRTKRPPLSFSLLCKFFLLSLAGSVTRSIPLLLVGSEVGVSYGSPTLGSAMSNLIPAFTFLLAVAFRELNSRSIKLCFSILLLFLKSSQEPNIGLENLDLRSSRSLIKILGTLVSISGALIVTLYKGPPIGAGLIKSPSISSNDHLQKTANNWVIGGLFFAMAGLSISVWNIFQAPILRRYPSEITVVSFFTLFGAIQCAAVALIAVKDSNAWKLRPDFELITIIYSAVFGGVVSFGVQTWCIKRKGPVFVAIFKPLGIGIAAIMGVIFLGDTLYIGRSNYNRHRFYGVMWAQTKEGEKGEAQEVDGLPSTSDKAPLLQSRRDEQKWLD